MYPCIPQRLSSPHKTQKSIVHHICFTLQDWLPDWLMTGCCHSAAGGAGWLASTMHTAQVGAGGEGSCMLCWWVVAGGSPHRVMSFTDNVLSHCDAQPASQQRTLQRVIVVTTTTFSLGVDKTTIYFFYVYIYWGASIPFFFFFEISNSIIWNVIFLYNDITQINQKGHMLRVCCLTHPTMPH